MANVIPFTVTLGNATIGFDFDFFCSHSILFEAGVNPAAPLQPPAVQWQGKDTEDGDLGWLLPFPPQRY